MKQYIKSLALFLLIGLGFASCAEADMGENVTYPEKETLGNWDSEYTFDDAYNYNLSLSVNAAGDTVCSFVFIDKETGETAAVMTGGICKYDPAIGLTTASFSMTPYGYPGIVYLARQRTLDRMSVQLHVVLSDGQGNTASQKVCSFNAIPAKAFPISNTFFAPLETGDGMVGVLFYKDNRCEYYLGAHTGDLGDCTYTFDTETGEGSIVNAKTNETLLLSIDADNHLLVTVGENSYKLLQSSLY